MPIRIPLLGFEIRTQNDIQQEKERLKSPVPPQSEDGAYVIQSTSTGWKTVLDQETKTKNEIQLITRYRDITFIPAVDAAIDEIVNELFIIDDSLYPIEIRLDDTPVPAKIKEQIREEFEYLLSLLEFKKFGYDLARRWYVDGRLYIHIVVDTDNPLEGVKDLRYVDPRKMKKVREIIRDNAGQLETIYKKHIDYFVYNENGLFDPTQGLKIAKDSVAYIHSGIVDQKTGVILSNLHKALKVATSLTQLENSLVIYRLARAPERRVFYLDVAGMPPQKAEQYMQRVMNSMKNQITYDSTTGEVITNKRFSPMLEDFFLARRSEGKATEVTTLAGGQNLGNLEDVEYFKHTLYEALNVPVERLRSDSLFGQTRTAEITKEEIKFHNFIVRLRSRFAELFTQLLEVQLSLKGVMTRGDFEKLRQTFVYQFSEDNRFSELKEAEIIQSRMASLQMVDPMLGKYFSKEWIVKNVLQMSEEEWDDIKQQIDEEKANGEIPEMNPMDTFGQGAMGGPGMFPPPGGDFTGGGGFPPPDIQGDGMGNPMPEPANSNFPPKKKGPPKPKKAVNEINALIEGIWNKVNG